MTRTGLLTALCLLAACGGGSSSPERADISEPSAESRLLAANCAWLLRSDPDLLNIAFPDEGATYWVAAIPALPGTRLRIEAEFPQARYFSYNACDPALRPTDVLTDYQIDAAEYAAVAAFRRGDPEHPLRDADA